MSFKKGDILFSCSRDSKTYEYQIWISEIVDVIESCTPKGKQREPKYVLKAVNYKENGKQEFTKKESDLKTRGESISPVAAVNYALSHFFSTRDQGTPEERLLRAIFGATEDSYCTATCSMNELPQVIRDLQKFYALFEEAFGIEKKLAEKNNVVREAKE